MIAVKILCGCGQKYVFDVDPLNGRMPSPVQCPVCRMDGTAAANEVIAQMLGIHALQPVPAYHFPPVGGGNQVSDVKNPNGNGCIVSCRHGPVPGCPP